jgi:UDP-3-O-acyl-N-acetylglucosamine deacetylase
MEVRTLNFTSENEIMTKISLIDCGKEIENYIIYTNDTVDPKIKNDTRRTAEVIQHFIERIYDYGTRGIPIDFDTREIPITEDDN